MLELLIYELMFDASLVFAKIVLTLTLAVIIFYLNRSSRIFSHFKIFQNYRS